MFKIVIFDCACSYCVGIQTCQEGSTFPVCQVVTDGFGDHQVGCRSNGDLIHQHNSLRYVIFPAAQSAALAPRKEDPSLVLSASSRPADIFFPCWKQGSLLHLMSLLFLLFSSLPFKVPLLLLVMRSLLEQIESFVHIWKTVQLLVSLLFFWWLSLWRMEGWSNEAIDTLRLIGKQQPQCMGLPPFHSTNHLFQCLSFSLRCGNAPIWASRMPIHMPSEDRVEWKIHLHITIIIIFIE